jgi:hypothetical protein
MDSGLLIGLLGLGIGAFSLLLTYLFYKKSLRVKIPLFAIESRGPIGGLPPELSKLCLRYDNKPINYFTSSRIAIWNAGKETISKDDVVGSVKICPEEGYSFLDARIITSTNATNNFKIDFSPEMVKVDFDYIDKDQGCCIEIYHNGKTSWSLNLNGTVKGAEDFRQAVHLPFPKRKKKAYIFSLGTFIVGVILSFLIFGWDDEGLNKKIFLINGFFGLLLYGIGPGLITAIYLKANRTSLKLGVSDDDQRLRSPGYPFKERVRDRDKDADPTW